MTPSEQMTEKRPTEQENAAVQNAGQKRGKCILCGVCVEACPGRILELGEKGPRAVGTIRCWRCGLCIAACPTGAVNSFFPFTMDI